MKMVSSSLCSVLLFSLVVRDLAIRQQDATAEAQVRLMSATDLPCTLALDHRTVKKEGSGEKEAAFSVMLKCSEPVRDSRLMVPWLFRDGSFPLNIKRANGSDEIPRDASMSLWSSRLEKVNENDYFGVKLGTMLTYVGSEFKFIAKFGPDNEEGSVSIVITEPPATTEAPTTTAWTPGPGTLPCRLTAKDPVRLSSGGQGFSIVLDCSEDVIDVVLTIPGYVNTRFPGTITKGKHTLITLEKKPGFAGKAFVVNGKPASGGDPAASNQLIVSQATIEMEPTATRKPGGLPCLLETQDIDVQGGGEGFELSLKCDERLTDVVLKCPGYEDKHMQDLEANTDYTIGVYKKQDALIGKAFVVEGKTGGVTSTTNEVVPQPQK